MNNNNNKKKKDIMVWNTILRMSLHYIHYIEQYLQGIFGHFA